MISYERKHFSEIIWSAFVFVHEKIKVKNVFLIFKFFIKDSKIISFYMMKNMYIHPKFIKHKLHDYFRYIIFTLTCFRFNIYWLNKTKPSYKFLVLQVLLLCSLAVNLIFRVNLCNLATYIRHYLLCLYYLWWQIYGKVVEEHGCLLRVLVRI